MTTRSVFKTGRAVFERRQTLCHGQVSHTAVMSQRAGSPMAADAVEIKHQIYGTLGGIFAPDGEHRAKQRDHGQAQGSSHVSRSAIGRNHHPATPNARFRGT